jgi:hypothetical protein
MESCSASDLLRESHGKLPVAQQSVALVQHNSLAAYNSIHRVFTSHLFVALVAYSTVIHSQHYVTPRSDIFTSA